MNKKKDAKKYSVSTSDSPPSEPGFVDDMLVTRSDVSLWRAVVMQAIVDCYTLSKRTENQNARLEAIKWISSGNRDFLKVCQYADLDPYYVIKKTRHAISNRGQWRNDIHKKKRLNETDHGTFVNKVEFLNNELFNTGK
ncbi:hypothetical protein [Candidatus Deianiraea vastatrix]|uniref:Uncharacterized protein n=1 Tax=Candidatus Deianiraea vastatrix TaxID=2163644 RepID=A0A5B8XDV5_9RICK|nr:hypothetical protein [Candidatus Deianiraea vastatrix]QED23443.1 hypothetical protein Deia_00651 [Candidatus Deianiraea vastatrix]